MEQDKQLKEILSYSTEGVPDHFTDAVMKKVNALPVTQLHAQPLVSRKVIRAFIFTYIAVVTLILLLCVLMRMPDVPYLSWIQNILRDVNYGRALVVVLLFWMVFAVNTLVTKRWTRMPD
jgi:hypothetical protein